MIKFWTSKAKPYPIGFQQDWKQKSVVLSPNENYCPSIEQKLTANNSGFTLANSGIYEATLPVIGCFYINSNILAFFYTNS